MSVVVKREQDGRIINFIKGADMAVVPRLTEASKTGSAKTIDLMNYEASHGLRTLMFSKKDLDAGVEETIKEVPEEELEKDQELLGITGLEDLL